MPTFEWTTVGDEPGCRQAAAMDPQIKLFGQTINVSPSHTGAGADAGVLNPPSAYTAPPSSQDGEDSVHFGAVESKGASEKLVSAAARCSSGDELFQLHMKNGREGGMAPASGVPLHLCDEQSEGGVSDERDDSLSMGSVGSKSKAEKVVACPRCSSQDTKFCYYNNYNVNQPRHFCKNCQRYWTAGGTLRNVPVGAGRRKNKASGGVHQQQGRESSEASLTCSSFQMELSEFSCGMGSPKTKVSPHPKRVGGQGSSPVPSPGSSGQESGLTTYSLYQNGRLPFQSFIGGSQDFTASEISAVGSSDTASTRRARGPRLLRLPSGNGGLDLECSRSSRSEHMLDTAAHLRVAPNNGSLRESSESGWAGNNNNGGQALVQHRFFNGEWPNGYPVDWDRKQHHHHQHHPVLTNFSNASSSVPTPAPWLSTPCSSIASPWAGPPQVVKRQGERLEDSLPAKASRGAHVEARSKWPMLQGKSSSSSSSPATTDMMQQLLQPKLQPSDELNSAFMNRLFSNARRVPFPVTI